MTATFAKLKNGEWGVRVEAFSVVPGQTITVSKRDGSNDTVEVDAILHHGDEVYLCSIKKKAKSVNRSASGQVCAECGRSGRLVRDLEDGMLKHYNCCDIPPGGY